MKQKRMKPDAKQDRQPAGQGIVEYLIIISLVALAIIVIVNVMQPVIGGVFSDFVANARVAPPELVGFTRVAPTATATPDTALDLTVNLVPDASYGNVGQSPTGPTYNYGTVVELTANPEPGYGFSHWSGDLDTTDNPAQITMDEDKTVDANFAPCYDVTAVADPAAGGSVSIDTPSNCSGGQYVEGTDVTFTADAAAGYVFDEWDDGSTDATRTITVDGNETVTANFAASTACYSLNTAVSPTDSGFITVQTSPNCGSNQYNAGTDVTFTASPNAGYEFDSWSDQASGTDPTVTIDMDSNKTVTANFVTETFEITINVSGSGSVSKNPDQATYDPGTVVRLTASPASGWEFDGWTGDATGSALIYDLTVDSDKTVNAFFGQICYALSTQEAPDGTGSVSVSPAQNCSGGYTAGTDVTLEAVPVGGYDFDEWTGDVTGTTNPTTFTINEDRTVTANFVESSTPCYALTTDVDPSGGGSVTVEAPNCGDDRYEEGTVVDITASPATGHEFRIWSGDVVSGDFDETVTMNGDRSVTAEFDPLCYDVYSTVDGGQGGVIGLSPATNCSDQYEYGTEVTFTATPDTGYAFEAWGGDLSGITNNSTSLIIDGTTSVIAYFSEILPLVDASFDNDAEGFSYQDDAFRSTNEPDYATGNYEGSEGNPDGSLHIELGGVDNSDITDMSGGWQTSFTLSTPGAVSVSFDYFLEQQSNKYGSGEYSEILVAVDGVLYGAGGNDYVDRISGGNVSTGWQSFSFTTGTLSAGTYTITLGGYNNQKTHKQAVTTIYVDNVLVEAN